MQTHKKLILFTILLAVFVVPSSISGTAIALPYIASSLGDDATLLQWVVNAFNVFFACFTLIWGALADRLTSRVALMLGVSIFLLGSLLSIFADSLIMLDIGRAMAGIGGASVFACGSAILVKTFDEKERLKAFALFGMTAGLGITLSPSISGLLIDSFKSVDFMDTPISWRAIFAFHFIILSTVLLLGKILPKEKAAKNSRFDTLGSSLFIVFAFCFMLFITRLSTLDLLTLGILCISLLSALTLIFHQRHLHRLGKAPLLDFTLLKNKRFFGFSLVAVISGFSFVVLLTYFPTFLSAVFGYSAFLSGIFMLTLTSPMLFCPLLAGKILSKGVDSAILALIMSLLMSVGIFALLVCVYALSGVVQVLCIGVCLFVIGCGMGLHAGGIDNLALGSLKGEGIGLGAGLLNTLRLGSESIGVALYASLMLVFIHLNQSLQTMLDSKNLETNSLIQSIASGNLPANLPLQNLASIYQESFIFSLGICGGLSVILSLTVYVLLKGGK